MDALAFDQMLPEYQENRKDVEEEIKGDSPLPGPNTDELYEAEIGGGSTVPVAEEVDSVHASSESADGASNEIFQRSSKSSSTSSSNSAREGSLSEGAVSFYHPSATSPTISYERDFPSQKLIAVFGRQFDRPEHIASSFQKLVASRTNMDVPSVKFVPFMLKRKMLLKGSYSSDELLKHDLVCMCYNASEARILLTGTDGFYTSLLRHTEAVLGNCHTY